MQNQPSIQYITRHKIDNAKWNTCIHTASNSLIYAYSWWLDSMTVNWDALVLNDYEAVMPLTWNKKYGIKYLYQPPFTQQLGIFSQSPVPEKLTALFLSEADHHFKFAEICLNYGNPAPALTPRTNFVLPLFPSYEIISRNYKKGLTYSLKKALRYQLRYEKDYSLTKALELNHQVYGARIPHLKNEDYKKLQQACLTAHAHKALLLRAVYNEQKTLLALALLLQNNDRIYLIQSTTLPEGRKAKANHYLLDNIIREFSGKPVLLDFEGSGIPGIASFYESFGAIRQPYFFYKNNNLPWPVSLLKK